MIKQCRVVIEQQHRRGVHVTDKGEQHRNTAWEKLNIDWLKCNVDVAFHNSIATISFGCCTRNSNGEFVKAQTMCQQSHMTILEGKTITLWEVIWFVESNRWKKSYI